MSMNCFELFCGIVLRMFCGEWRSDGKARAATKGSATLKMKGRAAAKR